MAKKAAPKFSRKNLRNGCLGMVGLIVLCGVVATFTNPGEQAASRSSGVNLEQGAQAVPTFTNTPLPVPTATATAVPPTEIPTDTPPPAPVLAPTDTPAPPPVVEAAPIVNDQAFTCVGGCATPPDPSCAIKGNVNSRGDLIYHAPGWRDYNRTDVKPEEGDRWFCTEDEARAAGFRAPENP